MPILCSGRGKSGIGKRNRGLECKTVAGNAKLWPGMQTRGAEMQEGGLNLGHPLGWLRVCCSDRCNLACRQWGCWAAKLRNCEVRSRRGRNRWNCCERCVARAEPMRCERCVANNALRTMCCERCVCCDRCVRGSEGALVVLLQVLCYRVGDEGESIHVPSLRPVGVNLCRFLH